MIPKYGWKHYPVGFGIIIQISGKKDFTTLRNSQSGRGIPVFLTIPKWQMDIVLGSGCKASEQEKAACHQIAKRDWKHYQVGIGMFRQICGKRDFATSRNSQIERVLPRFLEIT